MEYTALTKDALISMSVKDLKARLKELNSFAKDEDGEVLDQILEEANIINGILQDARARQRLATMASEAGASDDDTNEGEGSNGALDQMTFNSQVFKQMCDTARVSEFTGKNKKTYKRVKFGGISNQRREKYVICFHYEDPVDGDLYVMIVGSNQAGFSLAFAKDKETVTDAEFKAEPMDEEGTLIDFYEESGTASQVVDSKE